MLCIFTNDTVSHRYMVMFRSLLSSGAPIYFIRGKILAQTYKFRNKIPLFGLHGNAGSERHHQILIFAP